MELDLFVTPSCTLHNFLKNEQKYQQTSIQIFEGSSANLTLGKRFLNTIYVFISRFVSCKNMNTGEKSCCKHHSGPNHGNRLTFASNIHQLFKQNFCVGAMPVIDC
jgi:hypothetical protein